MGMSHARLSIPSSHDGEAIFQGFQEGAASRIHRRPRSVFKGCDARIPHGREQGGHRRCTIVASALCETRARTVASIWHAALRETSSRSGFLSPTGGGGHPRMPTQLEQLPSCELRGQPSAIELSCGGECGGVACGLSKCFFLDELEGHLAVVDAAACALICETRTGIVPWSTQLSAPLLDVADGMDALLYMFCGRGGGGTCETLRSPHCPKK